MTEQRLHSGLSPTLTDSLPAAGGLWQRLLNLLPRYRKPLFQAIAIVMAGQALALLAPWFLGLALNQALPKAAPSQLNFLCLGMVLTTLFRAWVGWIQEKSLLEISSHFEATLEKELFEHLMWLPFPYLQSKSLGELHQAFSGLASARNILLNRGLSVILQFSTAVLFLTYMALILPGPTVLVLIVALALSLLTFVVGRLMAREQLAAVQAGQKANSAMVELLSGAATLKATGCQEWAYERWATGFRKSLHHDLRSRRTGLWSELGNEILHQGLTLATLIWGGYKVLSEDLSLGSLVVFTQLSSGLVATLLALAQEAIGWLSVRPQLAAAEEILRTERQPRPPASGAPQLSASVVVDKVWFRYGPGRPWIIQGCDLKVEAGGFHHLKAASGSGKSTLLKLLAGLYRPEQGSITIGGMDTQHAANLVAFLPQFPQLHGGSILENMKQFSGGANNEKIIAVAQDTGLDAWVGRLALGYQTPLTSGGTNLSGGQRQLLAITAVLASPKPILLLDEALSSLDWVSRTRILDSPYFHTRTVIYASHEELLPDHP